MKKGLFSILALSLVMFVASCGSQKSSEEVVVEDSTTVVDVAPAPVEDTVAVDSVTVEEVSAQ
jgi:hypothetical protein